MNLIIQEPKYNKVPIIHYFLSSYFVHEILRIFLHLTNYILAAVHILAALPFVLVLLFNKLYTTCIFIGRCP